MPGGKPDPIVLPFGILQIDDTKQVGRAIHITMTYTPYDETIKAITTKVEIDPTILDKPVFPPARMVKDFF